MAALDKLREKNREIELSGETTNILKDMSIHNLHHVYVRSQNELRSQREKNIIGGQDYQHRLKRVIKQIETVVDEYLEMFVRLDNCDPADLNGDIESKFRILKDN